MSNVARIGDIVVGTCRVISPGHPREFVGVWVTGSDTLYSDNIGVVRVGDVGHTDCGHTFVAVVGSDFVENAGSCLHRVGDPVLILEEGGGEGVSVTGSDTFFCK